MKRWTSWNDDADIGCPLLALSECAGIYVVWPPYLDDIITQSVVLQPARTLDELEVSNYGSITEKGSIDKDIVVFEEFRPCWDTLKMLFITPTTMKQLDWSHCRKTICSHYAQWCCSISSTKIGSEIVFLNHRLLPCIQRSNQKNWASIALLGRFTATLHLKKPDPPTQSIANTSISYVLYTSDLSFPVKVRLEPPVAQFSLSCMYDLLNERKKLGVQSRHMFTVTSHSTWLILSFQDNTVS